MIEALPVHIRRTLQSYLCSEDERFEPLPVQEIADMEGVTRVAIYKRLKVAEKLLNHPIKLREPRRDKNAA